MDQTILNKIKEYFHDNESTKQYLQIISTALDRQKDFQTIINKYALTAVRTKRKEQFKFYTEVHHIIPESIDITYAKYKPNWIILTGEEHFTVHKLLVDMCINKDHYYSMCEAYGHMSFHNKGWTVTAEEYAIAKKLYAEAKSIKMTGIPKPNVSKALTGKKRKPFTKEHLDNLSKSHGEPVECYIIVEGKEITLDNFNSLQEATNVTNGCGSRISEASNGKAKSSGTYNLDTKQYNEISGNNKVPNNKYPNTYKCHWRKIKE